MNKCLECGEETIRPKFCRNEHVWKYYNKKEKTEEQKNQKKKRLKRWHDNTYKKRKDSVNVGRRKKNLKDGNTSRTYGKRKHTVKSQTERLIGKTRSARIKYPGDISLGMVQRVYEDNIKKYGTLTCYICLNQISFGKDTLEHKIPAIKGGTNDYDNLEVACHGCNCGKKDSTVDEYIRYKHIN
jgi:5-methylcytosine-specific restriction endonuclease McrA